MSIYSKLLFRGTHTGPQTVVYTTPTTMTAIIRYVTAYNAGGATDAFEVAIGGPGDATPIWHISNVAAASDSRLFHSSTVVPSGMNIYVASGGGAWNITISGYELTP